MPAVTFDLTGHTELLAAMDKLDSANRGEVVDKALLEAGDYVLGRIHTHHNSRRLRQYMRPKVWHGHRGRTSVNIATPKRELLKIAADDENYWPAAYNYGYLKAGQPVVVGAHFMEKGFDESEHIVMDNLEALIFEQIEEIWSGG